MVQKIDNYGGNFGLSNHFQYTGNTGLTFNYTGGAVTGPGAIKESAAGSIAVPANTNWSIYVDFTTGLLAASATTAVPSTDSLILYQGTSSSNNILAIADVRSWASSSINVGLRGFNEYLTTTIRAVHDWRFDEVSPNIIEDFGDGLFEVKANLTPSGTYSQTGDVSYETDDAMDFDGISDWAANLTTGISTLQGGTAVFVFASDSSYAAADIMIDNAGQLPDTDRCFFRPTSSGGQARFEFRIINGTYDAHTQSANVGLLANFDDGNYNMWVVTQAQDGNGPQFYLNGSPVAQGFTNYANGGSADDWFADKGTGGRMVIASATALGNNIFDGRVARVYLSDDVMTAGQVATLNTARTTLV